MIARGARRPKSRMRGLLQPFVPLLLSWRGRGELATLTSAETGGIVLPPAGSAVVVGFYLNELVLRFLHRHDPEPTLFDHYRAALDAISHGSDPEPVLRIFEKRLLQADRLRPGARARGPFRPRHRAARELSVHDGCRTGTLVGRNGCRRVRERVDPSGPRSRESRRPPCAQGGQATASIDHRRALRRPRLRLQKPVEAVSGALPIRWRRSPAVCMTSAS